MNLNFNIIILYWIICLYSKLFNIVYGSVCSNSGSECQCSTQPISETRISLLCKNITREQYEQVVLYINNQDKVTLMDVSITSSNLQELIRNDVRNFDNVQKLNLSNNYIRSIAPGTLYNFSKLQYLDLSRNQLTELAEDTFIDLKNLLNLSLAYNRIQSLQPNIFRETRALQNINLAENLLMDIPKDLFSHTKELIILSLSYNKIHILSEEIFQNLSFLTVLDLSDNELTQLLPSWFQPMRNLHSFLIANNNVTTMTENAFKYNEKLQHINIIGNPWLCDEKIYWIHHWAEKNSHLLDNKYEIKCESPENLKGKEFLKGLEILHMTKKMRECPTCKKCNCSVIIEREVIAVNCSNRNLTELPGELPHKTKLVDLENNQIKSLAVKEQFIHYWINVSFFQLNRNQISSLHTLEGNSPFKNVIVLNITNNSLTEVPIHLLDQISQMISEIRLGNNPWKCDCNTVRFQRWLQDNYDKVKDIEKIFCANDNSNEPIYRIIKSDLCPQNIPVLNYLDIMNIIMGMLILVIISKVTYDYWQQKRTGKLPKFFSLNM